VVFQWLSNQQDFPVDSQPLSDADLDRLSDVLTRFASKRAMNVEQLDGFLAALICGPDDVLPSEYLPEIWGDGMVKEDTFHAQPILQDFLSLVMRHWNAISQTLRSGKVYTPVLLEDDDGVSHGKQRHLASRSPRERRSEDQTTDARVQQFPKFGSVGVLKPCCTTLCARIPASAG
jgi:uncharacterized protein